MLYLSTRGDPAASISAKSCSKAWRPTAACTCPSLSAGRRGHAAALARDLRQQRLRRAGLRGPVALHRRHPAADLRAICDKTYTPRPFGTREIVPLRQLEDGLYLEALSNGPTLAFKDMAMQLLGNLFEYELGRRGEQLNILGATSGDTGSAAEYAMRGKKGVRVFMTSPHGRMSPFQQAQMFSLMDANIHNIAVDGVFDDCQDMVKACPTTWTSSASTRSAPSIHQLGAAAGAGGVLLCRLLSGHDSPIDQKVSFTVPSGNFGNVCAGHVARMMGLPIEPSWWWPPTKTTCSTSSSAPASTACAAAPTPTRPPARRWTFPRPAISSASCLTCWGVMARARRCLAMRWRVTASLT
jgi:threonine synthase